MNTTNHRNAIPEVHTSRFENFHEGRAVLVFTRWEDTEGDAKAEAQQFAQAGCYFTRVFSQPTSALGAWRVVGWKFA
jgi:hypothetical protein